MNDPVRRVLWITLGLNVLVSGAKVVVGTLSGSLAMVADGYHSLLDGSNNVVGLIVLTYAQAPPDHGHPYGHRKFETAATLLIGLSLLGLAYRVVADALVAHPRVPDIGLLNWAVMGGTLGINVFVAWYEAREGRRLGSPYLTADAAHTRSDIYVTLGVVGSFIGARAGWPWTDRIVATAIAVFIAVLAVRILLHSLNVLTDRAPLPPDALAPVVRGVPGVRDCGEVRTRGARDAVYVDLVVYVEGTITLTEAHEVADRIESALERAFPQIVDVVVHLEPGPPSAVPA